MPIQAGHIPRLPGIFGMSELQSALQIASPEIFETTSKILTAVKYNFINLQLKI